MSIDIHQQSKDANALRLIRLLFIASRIGHAKCNVSMVGIQTSSAHHAMIVTTTCGMLPTIVPPVALTCVFTELLIQIAGVYVHRATKVVHVHNPFVTSPFRQDIGLCGRKTTQPLNRIGILLLMLVQVLSRLDHGT